MTQNTSRKGNSISVAHECPPERSRFLVLTFHSRSIQLFRQPKKMELPHTVVGQSFVQVTLARYTVAGQCCSELRTPNRAQFEFRFTLTNHPYQQKSPEICRTMQRRVRGRCGKTTTNLGFNDGVLQHCTKREHGVLGWGWRSPNWHHREKAPQRFDTRSSEC